MNNHTDKVEEFKANYRAGRKELPYEEKFKIIIELQKIDFEFQKRNPKKKMKDYFRVWKF